MFTYNPKKPLPYVYKCTERETGRFYIGYRCANIFPSEQDLGVKYFTSNLYVKMNWDKFDYEIIAEFFNKKDAFKFESQLIKETRCELQINNDKHIKTRGKKTKYCTWR